MQHYKKVLLNSDIFSRVKHEERFALSITLMRISNSLVSTWRQALNTKDDPDYLANRERTQAFLNTAAVLYEGIQTLFNNQKLLRDLKWYKNNIDQIQIINHEVSTSNSFYNTVMREVRNRIVFHVNPDADKEILIGPNYEMIDPIVVCVGSGQMGDTVFPLADWFIEKFLLNKFQGVGSDKDRFERMIINLSKLQRTFVDVVANLLREIFQGYGAYIEEENEKEPIP